MTFIPDYICNANSLNNPNQNTHVVRADATKLKAVLILGSPSKCFSMLMSIPGRRNKSTELLKMKLLKLTIIH